MESPQYARHQFSQDLQELEHDLLEMGSRAEQMVGLAVDALVNLDPKTAMEVLRRDDDIDERDLDIENRCLRLLALQAPTGSDLRTIGTAMKMITDIERVGDLAVDIAKTGLKVEQELGDSRLIDFPLIANLARTMFRNSLQAYVRRDIELVQEVCKADDEVDELYRQMRNQLHDFMRHNPNGVVSASWLLLALHHIERIADHAVNIAERVAFMVTGRLEQLATSHQTPQPEA